MLDFLFGSLGISVVRAVTDTRNERSGTLLKRLGFAFVERKENADHFKGGTSHENSYELRRASRK